MISLDKVLLVVNTDNPLSAEAAQYYIDARGLNPSHVFEHSMGAGTRFDCTQESTAMDDFIIPLASYIQTNAIEAVVCSACVPLAATYTNDSNATGTNGPGMSSVCGFSQWLASREQLPVYDGAGTSRESIEFNSDYYLSWDANLTGGVRRPDLAWQGNGVWVPHGRLGLARIGPVWSAGYNESNLDICKRIIDDAVAGEQSIASAKANDLRVMTHIRDYNNPFIPQVDVAWIFRRCQELGLPVRFAGNRDSSWNYPAADMINPYLDPGPDYTFPTGPETLSPAEPVWAWFSTGGNDYVYTSSGQYLAQSYILQQGGWGYQSWSGGMYEGAWLLYKGFCSVIGMLAEPWGPAANSQIQLFDNILSGMPMMEAMCLSRHTGPWMMDCWGDPLYRPFGREQMKHVNAKEVR